MNFKIVSIQRFSVGINFYQRNCRIVIKNNGLIKITNVLTGEIVFDNLNPNIIYINNNLMQNISELQAVVYNKDCDCTGENNDNNGSVKKIFDLSFDLTFE